MKPKDLGLPAKYSEWRLGQDDAIIDTALALQDYRFYVSAQPTGAGKSVFNVGLAALLGAKRTLILTANKPLATQYETDFGITQIKGQNNYPCIAVQRGNVLEGMAPPSSSVDDGPCHSGVECPLRDRGCLYFDDVRKALNSPIVVTNYDYWMYNNKYGDMPIGVFDLLICDEASEAPEKLADFVSIYLSQEELYDTLGKEATLPETSAPIDYWIAWAKRWFITAKSELESHKEARSSYVKKVRRIMGKLEDLSHATDWKRGNPSDPGVHIVGQSTDWVVEEHANGVLFSPLWAHGYAEQFLFSNIPRVVFTSATIVPQTLAYLGLRQEEFVYNERPSVFPKSRRPIYVLSNAPNIRFNQSRGEDYIWINKIDYGLTSRLDRKSIVHAHSYDRAKAIYQISRYQKHMVYHSKKNLAQQVEEFKRRYPPAILISPAVKAGFDFPYQQCEYQVIAKIPFPPLQSAVMKARHKADKRYYNYLTVMSLVQEVGRGMRAADDFCETAIIDGTFWLLLKKAKTMFPQYFLQALLPVGAIPLPPPTRAKK